MKRIKDFKGFFLNERKKEDYLKNLNENVQAAKAFMLKKFAKKTPVSKEEEIEILSNKEYQEIKNVICAKYPGWVNAFVRFHFDQGKSLEDLIGLRNNLETYKNFLGGLPKNIDEYAKIVYEPKAEKIKKLENTLRKAQESGDEARIEGVMNQIKSVRAQEETDIRSGFEMLDDELAYIEKEREARWLIDALPSNAASDPRNPLYVAGRVVNLKDQYRNADPELKNQIINAGSIIAKSENAEENKERFLKKISAFDSIENLSITASSFSKALGGNTDKLLKQAEALYPGVAIMYSDEQYVALSLRSEDAQKELCGAANWCINRGAFWSYAKGNIQLAVFNFELAPTDRFFLIGITIAKDGKVTTSHDVNDSRISNGSEKYYEQLARMGYPNIMISEIQKYFDQEHKVKSLTDDFYKDGKSLSESINKFLRVSYIYENKVAFESVKSIFYQILKQNIELNMLKSKNEMELVRKCFTGDPSRNIAGGIMNTTAIELFDTIYPNPEPEFMKQVAEATLKNVSAMTNLKDRMDTQPGFKAKFNSSPDFYGQLSAMIEAKDEIIDKIKPWLGNDQSIEGDKIKESLNSSSFMSNKFSKKTLKSK